ncbi:MAG: hypothetical protein CVV50_04380 [Spirochaetae bacterium HGW-Spirochaetae-6]|nr:MAG: hypothetical protein CVV50_04380 [Spirochaetae bacterium HGW-Spirochaetae-6]
MEKKIFEVEVVYIITYVKKNDVYLYLITNQNKQFDFYRNSIKVEGIGFNQDKAQEMIRDFLVTHILERGVFVDSQKMVFDRVEKRKFHCNYYVNLTESKVSLKAGEFQAVHKIINIKNKLSDTLRTFLVNYIEGKKAN